MVCYFQPSPVTHVCTEYEQVLVSVLVRFPFKPHFPSTFHLYKKTTTTKRVFYRGKTDGTQGRGLIFPTNFEGARLYREGGLLVMVAYLS